VKNENRLHTIYAPALAKWWGSDARALAQAFRSLGHSVLDIDDEDYFPWRPQGFAPKVMRRLFGRLWIDDYNRAVLRHASSASYDFILVFKGNWITAPTMRRLIETGKPVYNFYPDVSFEDHGANIPVCLPFYDCVFTTKTFHGSREAEKFRIRDLQHVRHGFDPEVHRPIRTSPGVALNYQCDVSFVGCWSAEKEERLLFLATQAPEIDLRVYGMGWKRASQEFKRCLGTNLRAGVFGDELALLYCNSKVNLGLLSGSSDAALRDQTTARSFQIPASGAFMLHEDTMEIRSYFEADKEVLLFRNNEEMLEQIRRALHSPSLMETVRERAYNRCLSMPYDYSEPAISILSYFEESQLRNPDLVELTDQLETIPL
jgi:spore maturation protein CgeB